MAGKTPTDKLEYIPKELRDLPQWVPYYLKKDPNRPEKKPDKAPCYQYTGANRKARKTLDRLIASRKLAKGSCDGYSLVIDKADGFIFVDLDHCRDKTTGEIEPWAEAIIDSLDSYTEISASGTGIHIVCRGKLDDDFKVAGDPIEIYSAARIPNKLISLTGNLASPIGILDRQDQAAKLLAECKAKYPASESERKPVEALDSSLVFKSMEDVEEEPIEWLWPNRIPRSAISIYTGNPETGKTTVYCDTAARVSSMIPFPDTPKDEHGRPRHLFGGYVLLLAEEDNYKQIIKPNLMASGACLKKIDYIEKVEIKKGDKRAERMFAFDQDLEKLDAALSAGGPRADSLIIIDPISSYFGNGSMYKAQDVRRVFNPLKALCEKHRISIIAVEHFSKRVDVSAIHKLGGSVTLTAAPRAVFMFAKVPDEEGQYVMHFVKGNWAKRKVGLRFTIDSKLVGKKQIEGRFIKWGEEDAGTADDLLAAEKGQGEERAAGRAAKFLREYLADGKPHESDDMYAVAETKGVRRSALLTARKQGLVNTEVKPRAGKWYWRLIPEERVAAKEEVPADPIF